MPPDNPRTSQGGEVIRTDASRDVEHATVRVLAEADSLEEAAPEILHGICSALDWDFGALWIVDRTGTELRCLETWSVNESRLSPFLSLCKSSTFSTGMGLPGHIWSVGEPVWIPDVVEAPNFPRAPIAREVGLHGAFGFPIFVRERFYGVMEFFSRQVHEPDAALLEMSSTISRQIGDFIEWAEMEAELEFQKALLEYQGEAALDGIGVISPDLEILYWNNRILQMFGLEADDLRPGDAAPLIDKLLGQTANPEEMAEIAQSVLGDPDVSRRLEVGMSDGRTFDVWTAPVRGPDERLYGRAIYCRDITDLKRSEAQQRRDETWAQFLDDATRVLSESLEVETILDRLAELTVPTLADWCAIELADNEGILHPVAVAHIDPDKVRIAREMQERYPADPNVDAGAYGVMRSRSPLLMSDIPEDLLTESAQDEEHLRLIMDLQLRSAIAVPIVARDRALGVITLVRAESGQRYTEKDVDLAQQLAYRAAFPIDNARLYNETRVVAQTLQKSFLPPDLPQVPGVDVSARYFAAGEGMHIGGDFYDAFRIDNRRWGFVLGDVSGKGLEAATVTTLARHTIRGAALMSQHPSEVLRILNAALLEQQQTDRFCTAVYAIVEPRFARVRVTVSSGGHPPPYVIRNDGSVIPVECGGTLLGFMDGIALRDATIELEFGDKLFLYTDGVLDIRQKGGMFGAEGLEKLLYECSKRGTEGAAEHIAQTVTELQGGRATDDIAYIILGVRSSVFNIGRRRARPEKTRGGSGE